jgi:predicted RecA/RadA family phage recombinase
MQGWDGEKITVIRTVPSGGVVADAGYVIGDEFLVACETASAGAEANFVRVGCCRMIPKTTGQTNTKGAKAYFNATSAKIENAMSATNYLIGTFEADALSGDTESSVILAGAPVSVGGVPGDIQGVTAGTGLTGGGTSGTVSLAVAYGATGTTACVGNDARLSDARTPTAHAASHASAGADAITPAAIGACADNDARLSDSRTPSSTLAHAASHATGQADAIAPSAIGAQAVVVVAVENNLASFDAAGSTKDSGIAQSSIAGAVTMGAMWNDNMRNSTNTAQSLADATAEIIDLEDVEVTGDVTYAAGTTSLATIPTTGVYDILGELTFAAGAGTYNRVLIYIDGNERESHDITPDNANPKTTGLSVAAYLTAGRTVALWGKQDSGGALNVTAGRLSIQRKQ